MHPDLHRYLDGELSREELSPTAASELAEWESLDQATALLRSERAPADLEWRVMSEIATARREPVWQRALHWLVDPQSIQLRPAMVLAATAVLAFAIALPRPAISPSSDAVRTDAGIETADPNAIVYVQFIFASQGAKSVEVAGDFNGWDPGAGALRDADGDGVWTGHVAVEPGLHKYMFVVDGQEWVTDPRAERYVDDGFGMRNALIAVAPPPRDTRS